MDFVPLAASVALIWKIVDFAKQCRVVDVDAIVTQASTWAAGVVVAFILANSDFAAKVTLANTNLGAMNAWGVVLVGLTISSTGSVLYDYKRAFDRSDSAAMPSLVTGAAPVVPPLTVDASQEGATAHHTRRRGRP